MRQWELYNLEKDSAENQALLAQYPELKAELIQAWEEYASNNDVVDHQGHYNSLYRKSYIPEKVD